MPACAAQAGGAPALLGTGNHRPQNASSCAASLHAHALLRYQLYTLLTRLRMAHEQQSGCTPTEFRSRQTANQQGMVESLQATVWSS